MDDRTPAQRRLVDVMTRRGGQGFRILRSAEAPLRTYRRDERSERLYNPDGRLPEPPHHLAAGLCLLGILLLSIVATLYAAGR